MDLTYELADPTELGVDPAKLADVVERARREIDGGTLPSCQLAVAREGRIVADVTLGDADPMSRYVIFSCTKGVIGGAIWLLMSEGRLDVGQKVSEIIPEFATNGKDVITVEQVLTHTSGFPNAPLSIAASLDRDRRLQQFGKWRLNWEPGSQFEYHPTSAHWVLAEVVERISGMDYRRFVRERLLEPLGLHGPQLGVPESEQGDIAELVGVGEPPTPEELQAVLGISGIDLGEVTEQALLGFNHPDARVAGVPGGGGIARAADLALFYQALLHNPGDLWDPKVLADATGTIRCTLPDPMTGVASNRSLGLVVAGDDGLSHMRSNLGRTVSAQAFGHAGAGGQIAWADPTSGLSFAYLTNGLDRNVLREGRRAIALSSRAAVCLAD
ncbi:MAG: beta-lactamase family protein [Actinomycetota bacterium]|nr:beta-lactamase family protein [Actinomycetota bacterium]